MPWTTVLSVSTALILLRTTESLKNLPSLSPSRMTGIGHCATGPSRAILTVGH